MKKKLRLEAFSENGTGKKIYESLQAINELKRREKQKQDNKTTIFQEKQFNKNRYKFSKQTVEGTFGDKKVQPSYDKQTADEF